MTKKEQERVAALEKALAWARALSWRSFSPNTIPPPEGFKKPYPLGFLNNPYNGAIYYASSSAVSHCQSESREYVEAWANGGRDGGSQGERTLFATRADALKDLRMKLQERYGKHLAEIDAEIAKAEEGRG